MGEGDSFGTADGLNATRTQVGCRVGLLPAGLTPLR